MFTQRSCYLIYVRPFFVFLLCYIFAQGPSTPHRCDGQKFARIRRGPPRDAAVCGRARLQDRSWHLFHFLFLFRTFCLLTLQMLYLMTGLGATPLQDVWALNATATITSGHAGYNYSWSKLGTMPQSFGYQAGFVSQTHVSLSFLFSGFGFPCV